MKIPLLSELDVSGKKVIVRMDLDVDNDFTRIETAKKTLDYLLEKKAKLIVIGHKGRPEGKPNGKLSLFSLASEIEKIINTKVKFVYDIAGHETQEEVNKLSSGNVMMLENLRFDCREEENNEEFSRQLASLGEVYVNEAFAVSHRAHASLVGIPKYLPHGAGMRFEKEVEYLSKVIENPERPLVFLISGVKEDKLKMIENIEKLADKVLVGGRLPEYIEKTTDAEWPMLNEKVIVAKLNPDKEDITLHSIEKFGEEIDRAKTIVLAGVVGKVEDEGHQLGTKRVFEAVANSSAYKVAGGGDTEAALTKFQLTNRFDWISVGGGAMLEFLAKGTLPGIKALL